MWYTFWMADRWLLLNFDALGALAVLVTTLFALAGFVGAGLAVVCVRIFSKYADQVRYWISKFGLDHFSNGFYYISLLGVSILNCPLT